MSNFQINKSTFFNDLTISPGPLISESRNGVVSTRTVEEEYISPNITFISNDGNISIPQNKISITYIAANKKDGKINSYLRNVKTSDGDIGFDSFLDAILSFNNELVNKNITNIALLQIFFGPGQTWVMPSDARTLIGQGCAYSNDPYTIDIGRKETKIQECRIVGMGQGASTIRGSCILNLWNLQNLGLLTHGEDITNTGGAGQFDLQLILQNFFWVGWFAINVKYTETLNNMESPDVSDFDIFDHSKNKYIDQGSTLDDIEKWKVDKAVELLMMNVWVQLSNPPLGLIKNGLSLSEFNPVLDSFRLKMPLFFINLPVMFRMFISNCNWISYDMPTAISDVSTTYGDPGCPPSLVQMNAQFLNTVGVTDTFFQMCSFSCREFGAPLPDFRSIQLWGHAKVSIANCQFSGRCQMQCNKIAAFGCYFLGTGIMPGSESTTHALIMTPPDWYYDSSAKKLGFPSGPRLIISGCQFITHTKKEYTYADLQADLLKLPFSWEKWNDPAVVQTLNNLNHEKLNIQFNQTSFYMVFPTVEGDFTQGFSFVPLELTNFAQPVVRIDTSSGVPNNIL